MANITINELNLAGADLFADSESFMNELDERQFDSVFGGGTDIGVCVPTPQASDYGLCPQTVDNCCTILEPHCG